MGVQFCKDEQSDFCLCLPSCLVAARSRSFGDEFQFAQFAKHNNRINAIAALDEKTARRNEK